MRKITYPIFLFLFMISCGGSSNYGTSLLGPGETSILETVQDEALRNHINDMMDDGWMELVCQAVTCMRVMSIPMKREQ